MSTAMQDLEFINQVVQRTDRRVDPHAFHYVHWGLIVLVWYPLSNFLEQQGELRWMLYVGVGSMVLGILLSMGREMWLSRKPRLEGENTFISRQLMLATFGCIGAGIVLSGVAPSTQFIEGRNVPIIWGLVYATMAYMIGVVYRRAFLYSGIAIFGAAIAAMFFPKYNGYILGPVMGLGLIIPGVQAELRVRALQEEAGAD